MLGGGKWEEGDCDVVCAVECQIYVQGSGQVPCIMYRPSWRPQNLPWLKYSASKVYFVGISGRGKPLLYSTVCLKYYCGIRRLIVNLSGWIFTPLVFPLFVSKPQLHDVKMTLSHVFCLININ